MGTEYNGQEYYGVYEDGDKANMCILILIPIPN